MLSNIGTGQLLPALNLSLSPIIFLWQATSSSSGWPPNHVLFSTLGPYLLENSEGNLFWGMPYISIVFIVCYIYSFYCLLMFCSNNGGPPILSSFEQPSSVRFFNLTVWPKWPMMLQIKHFKYNFHQKRSKEFLMECCFTLLILMKALIFWVDPVNNAFANPKIISVWNPQLLPVTTLKRINQLRVIMI